MRIVIIPQSGFQASPLCASSHSLLLACPVSSRGGCANPPRANARCCWAGTRYLHPSYRLATEFHVLLVQNFCKWLLVWKYFSTEGVEVNFTSVPQIRFFCKSSSSYIQEINAFRVSRFPTAGVERPPNISQLLHLL